MLMIKYQRNFFSCPEIGLCALHTMVDTSFNRQISNPWSMTLPLVEEQILLSKAISAASCPPRILTDRSSITSSFACLTRPPDVSQTCQALSHLPVLFSMPEVSSSHSLCSQILIKPSTSYSTQFPLTLTPGKMNRTLFPILKSFVLVATLAITTEPRAP